MGERISKDLESINLKFIDYESIEENTQKIKKSIKKIEAKQKKVSVSAEKKQIKKKPLTTKRERGRIKI